MKELLTRIKQGHRTMKYPNGKPPEMPGRFRGRPEFNSEKCPDDCHACMEACPTGAIGDDKKMTIDLGKCLFCSACVSACPTGVLSFSQDYRLSTDKRNDLFILNGQKELKLAGALDKKMKSLFGRSLKLRQVSAGGCNACESDVNVLETIAWDLGRFGIQFVASPRHADGLLVTGPVTQNMELALKKTWDAVADPKIVIAVGACALSGGPYIGHNEVRNGVEAILPVDLFIPGCPPHPLTTLDGLLRLLDRLPRKK